MITWRPPVNAATSPRHPACPLPACIRAGGARPRLRLLLPVVRHLGRGRVVCALGATRARPTRRHRVVVLPRCGSLLLVGPARARSADGRDPRRGDRGDTGLLGGAGVGPGPPAAAVAAR